MPEKVHDCATKLQGEGKSEDSAWAICTDSIEETVMQEMVEAKLNCQCSKKR